jgi:hypothetical protein
MGSVLAELHAKHEVGVFEELQLLDHQFPFAAGVQELSFRHGLDIAGSYVPLDE